MADTQPHETTTRREPGPSVEVGVDAIAQLFDTLDPFPFRERDLDKDAEDYIVGWARELPPHGIIEIVVHAPERERDSLLAQQLEPALRRYFAYRADSIDRELRELLRIGRVSLAIGLATLAGCVGLSSVLTGLVGSNALGRFIDEGLLLIGSVANAKPIQTFLYDWWPVLQLRNLYRRLARANVSLKTDEDCVSLISRSP